MSRRHLNARTICLKPYGARPLLFSGRGSRDPWPKGHATDRAKVTLPSRKRSRYLSPKGHATFPQKVTLPFPCGRSLSALSISCPTRQGIPAQTSTPLAAARLGLLLPPDLPHHRMPSASSANDESPYRAGGEQPPFHQVYHPITRRAQTSKNKTVVGIDDRKQGRQSGSLGSMKKPTGDDPAGVQARCIRICSFRGYCRGGLG